MGSKPKHPSSLWLLLPELVSCLQCSTPAPGPFLSQRLRASSELCRTEALETLRNESARYVHLASLLAAAQTQIGGAAERSFALTSTLGEASQYLAAGKFKEARSLLGLARSSWPTSQPLLDLWTKAFEGDPRFAPPVATLTPETLDGIRPLGGGSTITLRFMDGETTVAAFKPAQVTDYSVYQAEIASWRLCEVLLCSFEIPYNRPVRIRRQDFERLYTDAPSGEHSDYSKYFNELTWTHVYGDDVPAGTEKAWVKDFTSFPIEVRSVWFTLLSHSTPASALTRPIAQAVEDWQKSEFSRDYVEPFLARTQDLDTIGLARQLSDMLVFDYLVQNMDRVLSVDEAWGENCQFGAGHLISIDNGAAFPPPEEVHTKQPIEFIDRFSRGLVQRVAALDEEQTRRWLFPDANADERVRFEGFWQRREQFLRRVDELVAKYGTDSILCFD